VFDWHFTSTHSSSQPFAPDTGSALHRDIIAASAWPWVAHTVSGLIQTTHHACWKFGHSVCSFILGLSPERDRLWNWVRPERTCLRTIHALFGLAFAVAPELVFLNLAA
jgi:hypothetical protein